MLNVVILVFLIIFYLATCVNNSDVHTHFHGAGTGTLLSSRYDRYWFAEFFFCIVALLLLLNNIVPATKQLNTWTFPLWLTFAWMCIIVLLLWGVNMVIEFLRANKCAYPLNRGNDLLWCSACHNVTIPNTSGMTGAQFCRWAPLPQDVRTTGELSLNTDFFWTFAVGSVIVLLHIAVQIIALIQYSLTNPDDVPAYVKRGLSAIASLQKQKAM